MPKRGSKIHIILYRFITSIKTCIFLHKPIMCHATSVFLKVNKFGFNCRNKLRIDNVDFFQRFSAYCTCYITSFAVSRYFSHVDICYPHKNWYRCCVQSQLLCAGDEKWEVFSLKVKDTMKIDVDVQQIFS